MRLRYLQIGIFLLLGLKVGAQLPVWTPDNGNGTFTNPILWGGLGLTRM